MTHVTLLTDFGTADGYAAAMVGAVVTGAVDAVVDHASHEIAPGDVFAAALALSRYALLYPEGTVHVVVVDPGVGSGRRALAARIDGRLYAAPDNGVLTMVLQGADAAQIVEVSAPAIVEGASATFHGRDIFAPAAAHLAGGGILDELGAPVYDPVLLSTPQPERTKDGARGEVIQVDRFGNLITSIPGEWPAPGARVTINGEPVGSVRRTYGDVASGEVVALIGSLGLLEVSVRDGSAEVRLGVGRGAPVMVRW